MARRMKLARFTACGPPPPPRRVTIRQCREETTAAIQIDLTSEEAQEEPSSTEVVELDADSTASDNKSMSTTEEAENLPPSAADSAAAAPAAAVCPAATASIDQEVTQRLQPSAAGSGAADAASVLRPPDFFRFQQAAGPPDSVGVSQAALHDGLPAEHSGRCALPGDNLMGVPCASGGTASAAKPHSSTQFPQLSSGLVAHSAPAENAAGPVPAAATRLPSDRWRLSPTAAEPTTGSAFPLAQARQDSMSTAEPAADAHSSPGQAGAGSGRQEAAGRKRQISPLVTAMAFLWQSKITNGEADLAQLHGDAALGPSDQQHTAAEQPAPREGGSPTASMAEQPNLSTPSGLRGGLPDRRPGLQRGCSSLRTGGGSPCESSLNRGPESTVKTEDGAPEVSTRQPVVEPAPSVTSPRVSPVKALGNGVAARSLGDAAADAGTADSSAARLGSKGTPPGLASAGQPGRQLPNGSLGSEAAAQPAASPSNASAPAATEAVPASGEETPAKRRRSTGGGVGASRGGRLGSLGGRGSPVGRGGRGKRAGKPSPAESSGQKRAAPAAPADPALSTIGSGGGGGKSDDRKQPASKRQKSLPSGVDNAHVAEPASGRRKTSLPKPLLAGDDLGSDDELVEQIYSKEVWRMMHAARNTAQPPSDNSIQILPMSLDNFTDEEARTKAVEDIRQYMALDRDNRRQHMNDRLEVFVITDPDHPAKKLQAETLGWMDIRSEERGVRAKRALQKNELLGEYCGVVKTGKAVEVESLECPIGFGGLKADKLKDFSHSHDKHVTGFWSDGKEIVMDPARGGNLLRFINDYVGMPGAVPCSCMMVEVMDRATLRPHIFFFAAADVPAGEEMLLDYGDPFRRFMESEAKRARSLVALRKQVKELEAGSSDKDALIAKLLKEKVDHDIAANSAKKAMAAAEEAAQGLRHQLEVAQAAAKDREDRVGTQALRIEELEGNDAWQLKKQLDEVSRKCSHLELKVKRLTRDCEAADNANRSLQTQLSEARREVDSLKKEVERSRAEGKTLQERVAKYKGKTIAAEKALEAVKAQLKDTQLKSKAEIERLSAVGKSFELQAEDLAHRNALLETHCRDLEAGSVGGGSAVLAAQHHRAAVQGRNLREQHARLHLQLPLPQAAAAAAAVPVPIPAPQPRPEAPNSNGPPVGFGPPPRLSRDPRLAQAAAAAAATAVAVPHEDRDPLMTMMRESAAPPPAAPAAALVAESDEAAQKRAEDAAELEKLIGQSPSPLPRLQSQNSAPVAAAHVSTARAAVPAAASTQPSSERKPGRQEPAAKLERLLSAPSVTQPHRSGRDPCQASGQEPSIFRLMGEDILRSASNGGMDDFIPLDDSLPPELSPEGAPVPAAVTQSERTPGDGRTGTSESHLRLPLAEAALQRMPADGAAPSLPMNLVQDMRDIKAMLSRMMPGIPSSAAKGASQQVREEPSASKAVPEQPKEGRPRPQESAAASDGPRQPPSSERETLSVEAAEKLPPANPAAAEPASTGAGTERRAAEADRALFRRTGMAPSPAESGAGGPSCLEGSSAPPRDYSRGVREREAGHRKQWDDRSAEPNRLGPDRDNRRRPVPMPRGGSRRRSPGRAEAEAELRRGMRRSRGRSRDRSRSRSEGHRRLLRASPPRRGNTRHRSPMGPGSTRVQRSKNDPCNHCKKVGHWSSDCWYNPAKVFSPPRRRTSPRPNCRTPSPPRHSSRPARGAMQSPAGQAPNSAAQPGAAAARSPSGRGPALLMDLDEGWSCDASSLPAAPPLPPPPDRRL